MLGRDRANHRLGSVTILVVSALACSGSEAATERWYFQTGVSYFETMDEIRSNAAIIYTQQYGDDGIPFTGDPNEKTTCGLNRGELYPEQDPFCDPRPDDLVAREPTVGGSFGLDVAAGFVVTPRFALQLNAGWARSDAPQVDVFLEETFPVANDFGRYVNLRDRSASFPADTGMITRVPVSLSGVIRFPTDGSLSLHAGAGGGYLFTDIEVDEEVGSLNERLASLRIKSIGDERGTDFTPGGFRDTFLQDEGRIALGREVSVESESGWFWHLTAGIEYRMTPTLGIVFDARYVVTSSTLAIEIGDEDQIDLITLPEVLFRPDGSLKIFSPDANAPNPFCGGLRGVPYGCIDADIDTRVNPEGQRAGFPDPLPGVTCPANGDFDVDGQIDSCYAKGIVAPSGRTAPVGFWVVQGGTVDLDYFSVGLMLRVHLPSGNGGESPPQ